MSAYSLVSRQEQAHADGLLARLDASEARVREANASLASAKGQDELLKRASSQLHRVQQLTQVLEIIAEQPVAWSDEDQTYFAAASQVLDEVTATLGIDDATAKANAYWSAFVRKHTTSSGANSFVLPLEPASVIEWLSDDQPVFRKKTIKNMAVGRAQRVADEGAPSDASTYIDSFLRGTMDSTIAGPGRSTLEERIFRAAILTAGKNVNIVEESDVSEPVVRTYVGNPNPRVPYYYLLLSLDGKWYLVWQSPAGYQASAMIPTCEQKGPLVSK